MPTNRLLLTLSDLKSLVAAKYGIEFSNIEKYGSYQSFVDIDVCPSEITDDSYIFQIDTEVE